MSQSRPQTPVVDQVLSRHSAFQRHKKTSPNLFLGGKVGHTLISDLKAQWKTNGAMPSQSMRNSGILMFASDLIR